MREMRAGITLPRKLSAYALVGYVVGVVVSYGLTADTRPPDMASRTLHCRAGLRAFVQLDEVARLI